LNTFAFENPILSKTNTKIGCDGICERQKQKGQIHDWSGEKNEDDEGSGNEISRTRETMNFTIAHDWMKRSQDNVIHLSIPKAHNIETECKHPSKSQNQQSKLIGQILIEQKNHHHPNGMPNFPSDVEIIALLEVVFSNQSF
jgi:hypothetical protein